MSALPVTVIRPKRSTGFFLRMILGSMFESAIKALFVWWLLPNFTDYSLSYWQSVAAVLVVGSLVGTNHMRVVDYWTDEATR